MTGLEWLLPGLAGAQNVHPMFVHFPIALLAAALALQVLAVALHREDWGGHARACLYLGTLGGVLAMFTGFRAADGLGHDSPGHELVHVHRNYMVASMLLSLLSCGIAVGLRGRPKLRDRLLATALVLTCTLLALGADRGANLVFRYGTAVANEPVPETEHEHDHDHDAAGRAAQPPAAELDSHAAEPAGSEEAGAPNEHHDHRGHDHAH